MRIRVSRYAPAPIAFKLIAPTIVLPAITIEKLDEEDLSAVLAHEVAHLRRHDPLVNIIQILLLGIWWFHPLYWLLTRQLRRTREECCDDLVLARQVTQDDRYCQVLLDAARASLCATTGGAILGFGESAESMHKRMQRIMSPRARKTAGIGICAGLVLSVLGVVFMPMWRSNATIDNPRPATTLPSSAFYHYKEATQAKGLRHRIGSTEFKIERCYRLAAHGAVCATDGRKPISISLDERAPVFTGQHASLDQAAIRFQRNSLTGHEILQVRIFDHRTRALLTQYHAPAAWDYNGQDEIRFKSFGRSLPDRVDVWFWVTQFGPEDMRQTVPAQIGATVEFQDYKAILSDLRKGVTSYSTTANGTISVKPVAGEDDSRILAAFMITPKRSRRNRDYARVAAVCKDGTRILYDRVIYLQNRSLVCDFSMKLSDLDHFELYPIGQESYFYFDGVRLPKGQDRVLKDSWEAVINTQGQTGGYTAAQSGLGQVLVTVLPGSSSMSFTSRQLLNSLQQTLWSPGKKIRNPDTDSTLVCEVRGLSSRMLKSEIIPLDANGQPIEDSAGFGRSCPVVYRKFRVTPQDIHDVHVKLTWSAED